MCKHKINDKINQHVLTLLINSYKTNFSSTNVLTTISKFKRQLKCRYSGKHTKNQWFLVIYALSAFLTQMLLKSCRSLCYFTEVMMLCQVQSRSRSVVELQVSGVRLSFTKRPYDTSLTLSVHGLLLVDALQTFGPDFELLVASHKHVGFVFNHLNYCQLNVFKLILLLNS